MIGDFNGHVGIERTYLERWHGGHSYCILNDEGRAIRQCEQMYDLAICNTFFQKKEEHMITYSSGTRQSTIDYILIRRQSLRFVNYCKVIRGETVATRHRPLILEMELEKPKRTKKRSRERQLSGSGNRRIYYVRNDDVLIFHARKRRVAYCIINHNYWNWTQLVCTTSF